MKYQNLFCGRFGRICMRPMTLMYDFAVLLTIKVASKISAIFENPFRNIPSSPHSVQGVWGLENPCSSFKRFKLNCQSGRALSIHHLVGKGPHKIADSLCPLF
ncbi:hypothetical protein TNIN_398371 [Trichonephila inaurata madagascariensis]|uniref:Uncharacterized protein n=1 Tax=Trichonephila inaurata madagascariensis TaxID=2747483 RepID=A0A8X6XAQ4_9ARAC|nr:hypothetical protein TNIN_398371 [Trichonephila inaurata madagascariensis]